MSALTAVRTTQAAVDSAKAALGTAPADMLPWLAQWVGMAADHGQDPDLLRQQLRASREQHASRGTRRGIELAVRAAFGVAVEVSENGAAAWSSEPGGPLPGDPDPVLRVRIRTARPDQVDPSALRLSRPRRTTREARAPA